MSRRGFETCKMAYKYQIKIGNYLFNVMQCYTIDQIIAVANKSRCQLPKIIIKAAAKASIIERYPLMFWRKRVSKISARFGENCAILSIVDNN